MASFGSYSTGPIRRSAIVTRLTRPRFFTSVLLQHYRLSTTATATVALTTCSSDVIAQPSPASAASHLD